MAIYGAGGKVVFIYCASFTPPEIFQSQLGGVEGEMKKFNLSLSFFLTFFPLFHDSLLVLLLNVWSKGFLGVFCVLVSYFLVSIRWFKSGLWIPGFSTIISLFVYLSASPVISSSVMSCSYVSLLIWVFVTSFFILIVPCPVRVLFSFASLAL